MEYKKILAVLCITAAAAMAVIIGYSTFGSRLENTAPVINTLSAEQISGVGYTGESRTGDYDVWEDTLPEDQGGTSEKEIVFPLDINTATAEELAQISGIGTVTAQNIISYRESYGYFYSPEDLLNVKGIGDKKLENIKDFIFISEEFAASVETQITKTAETNPVTTEVTSVSESETEKITVTADTSADYDDYEDDNELIEEYSDDFYDGITETVSFTETEYRPAFPLELNSASAKDLTYIDGIGETLAQRIVEYACLYGFYETEDLLNVSGIGESKLKNIMPYVYADSSGLPPRADTETNTSYDPFELYPPYDEKNYSQTTAESAQIYRINVNTAGKTDFMQLPGIDETTADNLLKLREDINGFEKVEEMIFAEGMTTEKLAAIWDYVYI